MIPIALLKKFGRYEFVTFIEVSNMRRCTGKANKLRYILNAKKPAQGQDIKIFEKNGNVKD